MANPRPPQRSEQRLRQGVNLRTSLNRYEYDRSKIPAGMTYEWKRKTVFGQEDTENLVNLEANGWEPVPAERHPELSGRRAQVGTQIVRGGLILMERPVEITEEARELDTFAARHQVAQQIQRLGLEGKRAAGRGLKVSYDAPDEAQTVPE
jgi:hypothetical protein